MAKNNLFDQDLDLQGISKIINFRFDAVSSVSGTPIQSKQGAAFFSTDEKSIRVNIDGTHWFSTVLFNGTFADVNYLAVFTPGTINRIEKLEGPDDGDALVQVSYDGSTSLLLPNSINFINYLDTGIMTDTVIEDDTRLITSGGVYDYIASALTGTIGDYLPLAGGTMLGNIDLGGTTLKFWEEYATPELYLEEVDVGTYDLVLSLNIEESFAIKSYFDPSGSTNTIKISYNSIIPIKGVSSTTDTYIGTPLNPFDLGYVNSAYINTIYGNGISSKLTLIGGANDTKIELGGDQVTVYDHLLPSSHMSKNLGGASMRWQSGYFSYLEGYRLKLSTGAYVIDISTTADVADPSSSSLLTESAVVGLFNTIKTITGADVADITSVGLVNRFVGVNPEDYLLQADNTWVNKASVNYWTYDAGTYSLGLNTTDLDIAKFEFMVNSASANNVLAMGVRGNYVFEGFYAGNDVAVFIGDLDTAILTDYTYTIEVVGDLRTRRDIHFGGVDLTDSSLVHIKGATIDGINALCISGAISTDGVNAWTLGEIATTPTPNCGVEISVNGTTYVLAAYTAP